MSRLLEALAVEGEHDLGRPVRDERAVAVFAVFAVFVGVVGVVGVVGPGQRRLRVEHDPLEPVPLGVPQVLDQTERRIWFLYETTRD